MGKPILKAHLALFTVNALYGASHIIAKGVMPNYITPNVFIFLRVLGATILFWIVKLLFVREKVKRKDILLLAICGVFGVAVNQLFFFNGLNLSSSINSGIIMTLNPIIVVVLSFFILKESLSSWRTIGIIIGTIGAVMLTLSSGNLKGDAFLGDMFLFINATSYALYLVLVKPLMKKYKPLTVITYVFTFGLLYVMLYPPTLSELAQMNFEVLPLMVVLKIIFVIVFVTFITYLLTVYALKLISPTVSSSYIYLQPILVILFAFLFYKIGISEDYTGSITLQKLLYMAFIFLGVYITSTSSFVKSKQQIK